MLHFSVTCPTAGCGTAHFFNVILFYKKHFSIDKNIPDKMQNDPHLIRDEILFFYRSVYCYILLYLQNKISLFIVV